ncbi:MAG: hypothetical protein FJ316_11355 [SAR202 cluster bacterium]|nr:hypothetical protein [SAR202 cluster bacterium]
MERFSIKFHDPAFLAIADYHYLMAPGRLIAQRQVPEGWGLLDEKPSAVVPAPDKTVRKTTGIVSNVLRAIARSNATALMHTQGVRFSEAGAEFPRDPQSL